MPILCNPLVSFFQIYHIANKLQFITLQCNTFMKVHRCNPFFFNILDVLRNHKVQQIGLKNQQGN